MTNAETFDVIDIIRRYLTALGFREEILNENVAKIFYTVALTTIQGQSFNEDQKQKLAHTESLITQGQIGEAMQLLGTVFEQGDNASWRQDFAKNIVVYLLDLSEKMSSNLTAETKQNLSSLLKDLSA